MNDSTSFLAQKNKNLLEYALRETEVGTWEWDVSKNIISFSSNISDILEIDMQNFDGSIEFVTKHILHPDYVDIFNVSIKEAFLTGYTSKTEYLLRATSDNELWVRLDGQFYRNADNEVTHGCGSIINLSSLKQVFTLIGKNINFLETLIQIIPSPMFYKDINGHFKYCNSAYAEFIGRPMNEITNQTIYNLVPRPLAEVYANADRDLVREGGVQVFESTFQTQFGNCRDIIFKKSLLLDSDNDITGIVGIILDITEHKESQRLIEKQNMVKDILISISHAITTYTTESDLNFDLLHKLLPVFEDCDNASILNITEDNFMEIYSCTYDHEGEAQNFSIPLKDSYIYKHSNGQFNRSKIIRNVQSYGSQHQPIVDPSTGLLIHETLYVPTFDEGILKFILTFNSSRNHHFSKIDCEISNYIGEQIPTILQVFNLNRNILRLSRYDGLTNLMNRHYFNETFGEHIATAVSEHKKLVLVTFDLDDLKGINDTFGHGAGDDYLKYFSAFISDYFIDKDIFARVGGDEFNGLFLVTTTDAILEKLLEAQKEFSSHTISSGDVTFNGRFSYGVAVYPSDSSDMDQLMTISDRRMYENKTKNTNDVPK